MSELPRLPVSVIQLVGAAQRDSSTAVTPLLMRIGADLARRARTAVRARGCNEHCAEDVWQNALLSIARSIPTFRGSSEGEWWAWCNTIVSRRAVDHAGVCPCRKEVEVLFTDVSANGSAEHLAAGGAAAHHATDDELAERLEAAIALLPPNQAEAFRLRLVEEMPYPDIAARQGCPIETARWRVFQAKQRLGAILGVDPERFGP